MSAFVLSPDCKYCLANYFMFAGRRSRTLHSAVRRLGATGINLKNKVLK